MLKRYCLGINSYHQAVSILQIFKKEKKKPIFYIKFYLIQNLGIDWLIELKNMLSEEFGQGNFMFFIDIKKNYGLCINLIEEKFNFIKVIGDESSIKRLNEIAKLNKVLINPDFSVVDISNTKNILIKLKKHKITK